jgi:hypothetical protein
MPCPANFLGVMLPIFLMPFFAPYATRLKCSAAAFSAALSASSSRSCMCVKLSAVLKETGRRENCRLQHLFPAVHHVFAAGAEASQWNQLSRRQIADHKA